MGNVIHAAERFRQPYTPRAEGEASNWMCIDERYALVEGLYRQIGGGPIGVGDAWAKAMIMRSRRLGRSSEVVDLAHRQGLASAPIQVLGGIAAKTLRKEGIELARHPGCARENGAQAITSIEAGASRELLRRSRIIKPDLKVATFAQITSISQALLNAGQVMEAGEAAQHLDNGGAWGQVESGLWKFDPVERVPIVDSPHISPTLLADYGRGVAFDVRAAFEAGEAAYHVSLGDMPDEIAGPLSDIVPFDVEDFMAATAVNHAATSIALDAHAPAGHEQIDIVRIA